MFRNTLLAATALVIGFSLPAQAAETYTLDPMHTQVVWSINHFGFSNPSGKFAMIEGTLVLDEAKPENSKVDATIQIRNLVTGLDKLNEHLWGDKFFDAAKFPTATFKSTKVEVTGKDTAKVTGDLTVRDITKSVTLEVKLNRLGESMMKKKTAGFSAVVNLKRSDFGMTTYVAKPGEGPLLGDDVAISVETEANLKE
jgi:polyisoprenoid-binding protein YceI